MSVTLLARGRTRRIAATLTASLALALAFGGPSQAIVKPAGSRAAVMLETGDVTGNPTHAITSGWWGHEGGAGNGTGSGSTFLSMDASDGNGTVNDTTTAALLAAMGTDDLSKIAFAIVPTSADGSAEAPTVTAGENAAEAFHWVMYQGFGGSLNGTTNTNDSVATVSTLAQVTAWVQAGRPVQSFDDNLVMHDATAPGSPVSTAPQGTSILDTWPAGTELSLVAFVTDGLDPDLDNQVPLVAVGPGNKAKTAWMPFTTVAKPGDPVRTSAGYQVAGAYAPTVSLSKSVAGTTATLTATVKNKAGAVATDATGTVEFAPVVNGTRGTATAVAAANGTATWSVNLAPGATATYDARYVPDTPGQATYLTSDWARTTVVSQTATSTAVQVTGGGTNTITATVTPAAAGQVTFKDGATTLGAAPVSGGRAVLVTGLAAGTHALQAVFTPSDSSYLGSTGATTVWKPSIAASVKPKLVKHGSRPVISVQVVAPGTAVSGSVVIVFDPPKGATKTITVTVVGGVAKVKLPKTVKGKTKLSLTYAGNGSVLGAAQPMVLKVR